MNLADGLKQLTRMCKAVRLCSRCPLAGTGFCSVRQEDRSTDVNERAAAIIEKWAEENPELVYPTWRSVLLRLKLINWEPAINMAGEPYGSFDEYTVNKAKMTERVPADLAQKLGLEPEEG